MIYANIITGGICCGKSSVCNLLRIEGYKIIDADEISRQCFESSKQKIIDIFGTDIIDTSKKSSTLNLKSLNANSKNHDFKNDIIIDRKKLGDIVFNDLQKKEELECILHPLIQNEISRQCEVLEKRKLPYFVEIPLFFESKFSYLHQFVICIYVPENIQLDRLMKRNNLSRHDALSRIKSQINIESKKAKSDFVIDNSKDLKSLQINLNEFLDKFNEFYS